MLIESVIECECSMASSEGKVLTVVWMLVQKKVQALTAFLFEWPCAILVNALRP